eukprot:516438-Pleurochrysis_carterae.AAC.1
MEFDGGAGVIADGCESTVGARTGVRSAEPLACVGSVDEERGHLDMPESLKRRWSCCASAGIPRAMNVLPCEGKAGGRRARAARIKQGGPALNVISRSRRKGSSGSRCENASAWCIGQTWQRRRLTAAMVSGVGRCVRTAPATILAVPADW